VFGLSSSNAGLTIILKALSAVLAFAVALKLKLYVVEELTSVGSPLIAPVEEFKVNPAVVKTVPPVSE